MPPPGTLRSAVASAFALILPLECSGCGVPDFALCGVCRAELEREPVRIRDVGDGVRVWSAASYEGAVAHALNAFKDAGATASAADLAAALRRALGAAVDAQPEEQGPIALVPVPSSAASTRRRGYVPLELIARAARLPLSRSLRQIRAVRDQAALSAAERAVNLDRSLAVAKSVRGRDVLLVDDVVTTGSTLREAARALRDGGARVLGAATIASTPSSLDPRPPRLRTRMTPD